MDAAGPPDDKLTAGDENSILGNDSARSFYFAVQQLSVVGVVRRTISSRSCRCRSPRTSNSCAIFPKLNAFNGFAGYGRRLYRAGASSPLVEINGFGSNPGAICGCFPSCLKHLRARAGAGRRAAWLRPDRGRLRSRRRLVDAGQALRLCAADAGAAGVEQRQHLLQLVQSGRHRARQRRGRLDPADDRADGRRSQNRFAPHLSSPGFPPAAP